MVTASAPGRGLLRTDERALLGTAGVVFALGSAGAAMSASAADGMFLSDVGPRHLGAAIVVSNILLAVVLAVVGGLADRGDRRRVLAGLALVSAVALAGLAAMSLAAPGPSAVLALVGGKQLAAGTDLAFWIAIAERIDARKSQRMLPLLAAMGGLGAAAGAVLVIPLAHAIGARGVLACAAGMLALAGAAAAQLPATRRVGEAPRVVNLVTRSWRDGARAMRRHPLAQHLAWLVAAAGMFAALAYSALGVAVAAQGKTADGLTELLGGVRAGGQILTLAVQIAIAPRLIGRLGTGRALLLAPAIALASGVGLVIAPILAVAIGTQIAARTLDAGLETPSEKLAQTLLPTAVRGRIAGFLDGTAKRLGAILGGVATALLATTPLAFYGALAVVGGVWFLFARRLSRELPALAVAHAGADAADGAVVDDRAIQLLLREVEGPRPERAAEVLSRLHDRGRIDASGPLARAAIATDRPAVWRALIAVLDAPAEALGPQIAARHELATRAIGLAGGVAPDALPGDDLTSVVARLRLAGDRDAVMAELGDAVRDTGPASRVAIEELCAEVACAFAAGAGDRVLEGARHLARALHRRRGDTASRAAGLAMLARVVTWARDRRSAELSLLRSDLLELARERVEVTASEVAPPEQLTSLMRAPSHGGEDTAPETAAALRLYGALLDGADAVDPDDLRRIATALGEPDDAVRAAAEAALAGLGPAAAGELIETAAWGRRRARDRAAALLHDLPVSAATIDRLVDAELDALDQTSAAVAVMTAPGDELIAHRLDERLREIAHTVLLLVAAQRRSKAIARAAIAWRRAQHQVERARALAVIDAALPRALVGRLVESVDELAPADRAAALRRAGVTLPARETVIRDELGGRDRLARALVLHALGAAGRSAHRETIASAARAEALAITPAELLRRVNDAVTDDDHERGDMPSRVETLIALGRVPLLAALTTRQLADVAERARWTTARAGGVIVTAGDPIDALIVVEDGELALGDRAIGKGEVVDELACVAPAAAVADLRVLSACRLIRLERVDFEELVDDVPGLASAVCRALGERARRAEEGAGYRSPLITRP